MCRYGQRAWFKKSAKFVLKHIYSCYYHYCFLFVVLPCTTATHTFFTVEEQPATDNIRSPHQLISVQNAVDHVTTFMTSQHACLLMRTAYTPLPANP